MSRRCLIAIGCDHYTEQANLAGAEADAQRVFASLMDPQIGDYDPGSSTLLLSPSLAEVRDALRSILIQHEPIETLTVFFAGHGGVKGGTFYILPTDASTSLLSATALSASELLSIVAEAAPLQTNLIFDACQAGGLSSDIRALLRPEDLGAANTPGVTVLAMAARDQSAFEIGNAGIGTTALIDCISGKIFVSDNRPTLDLLEIGTRVAEILAAAGEQAPVVWGLNLFGPRRFCRNPSFGGTGGPLRATLGDWDDAGAREVLERAMPKLWRVWDRLDHPEWSPREIVTELAPVLDSLVTGESRAELIKRLTTAAAAKTSSSNDHLRPLEARASILVAALRHISDPTVEESVRELMRYLALEAEGVIELATNALKADRYALLSNSGGVSDLFVLPLRLTRLGGWAGFAHHVHANDDPGATAVVLRGFMSAVLDQLPASVVSMSDVQAAPVACMLTAAHRGDAKAEGETFLGALFASAVNVEAHFASANIEKSDILRYLIARSTGEFDRLLPSLARPTELLTVLLRAAALFGLEAEFDPWLIRFDGTDINAFLPVSYADYADETIRHGVNAGFRIGHDVFTVDELELAWHSGPTTSGVESLTALLAALIFPDRTPWFLFNLSN